MSALPPVRVSRPRPICHCGAPVVGESDATPGPAARVLCERCFWVRCDAFPGACGWRSSHYLQPNGICSCGAQMPRPSLASGSEWHAQHLLEVSQLSDTNDPGMSIKGPVSDTTAESNADLLRRAAHVIQLDWINPDDVDILAEMRDYHLALAAWLEDEVANYDERDEFFGPKDVNPFAVNVARAVLKEDQ